MSLISKVSDLALNFFEMKSQNFQILPYINNQIIQFIKIIAMHDMMNLRDSLIFRKNIFNLTNFA